MAPSIWCCFLCIQVSFGNCKTKETLKICNFDPKASDPCKKIDMSNVVYYHGEVILNFDKHILANQSERIKSNFIFTIYLSRSTILTAKILKILNAIIIYMNPLKDERCPTCPLWFTKRRFVGCCKGTEKYKRRFQFFHVGLIQSPFFHFMYVPLPTVQAGAIPEKVSCLSHTKNMI